MVGLAALAVALVFALATGRPAARRARTLISMFQDDQELVYEPLTAAGDATVRRALATMRSLGVAEIRVSLTWAAVAPDPHSRRRPRFNAADPGAYPPGSWLAYDRIDLYARRYGIAVELDPVPPAPLWATQPGPVAHYAADYDVSARLFGQFVHAAGVRYDGHYRARIVAGAPRVTLPRVSRWSVWNEPNQPGWLAPQWRRLAGRRVPAAPRLYRAYLDSAWSALAASGHTPSSDTMLFGETAPEGCSASLRVPCGGFPHAAERPLSPLRFLRALYCVGRNLTPLRGVAAAALGCPRSSSPAAFVAANPALFYASGYAHHPYDFLHAPSVSLPEADFVPLSDLGRLQRALDGIFAGYGVHRLLPIWLTEYGYETDPPNPCRGVSLAEQAAWLDQATYIAWQDRRVRALSQFLLVDSAPDSAYPPSDVCRYWSTFQTGLEFLDGRHKPAFAAYRLPLWLPDGPRPRSRAGAGAARPRKSAGARARSGAGSVLVWGMVRPAEGSRSAIALIQWRGRSGRWRLLARARAPAPGHVFKVAVSVPGAGLLRFAWRAPHGGLLASRAVGVR